MSNKPINKYHIRSLLTIFSDCGLNQFEYLMLELRYIWEELKWI